jgi:aspartyl/asparaginyl beta-hydroxylase (cupin superfamily)
VDLNKPEKLTFRVDHFSGARSIPHLSQAFFSILDPGKNIPAHEAPTRSYLRYHLGLMVPETNPPSIRVVDEHYTWQEGESMLFDDSWDHEITNTASSPRAVLIVDFLRPMPAPLHLINRIQQIFGHMLYGPRIRKAAKNFELPTHITDAGR